MNRKLHVENGRLYLGGVEAVELTKQYGTPLYVMEEDVIRDAMRAYYSSMMDYYDGNGLVCYASKAFCCKELCRMAKEEGLGIDVVSAGELYTACSVDFPREKICFHGNNKTPAELRYALKENIGQIVVDSLTELSRVSTIANELGVTANILLRITPGVDAHTHDFIKTGQIDSKFGLALETGEALDGVKAALNTPNVNLKGLHCHIGSQIMEVTPFVHTAEIMMDFIALIKKETGAEMQVLNLGGGFGIRYVDEDDPVPYVEYLKEVSGTLKEKAKELGLSLPAVYLEPGRSIVGEAGTTLYTVGSVKPIPDIRTYVSVDGGMGDNIRYALYGAKYEMAIAGKMDEPFDTVVTVAGKYCESGDLLGENISLQKAEPGDILAVFSTGAYNYSMASRYNRNPVPPVVMVKDGKARVIIKGESLEDIIKNDI